MAQLAQPTAAMGPMHAKLKTLCHHQQQERNGNITAGDARATYPMEAKPV